IRAVQHHGSGQAIAESLKIAKRPGNFLFTRNFDELRVTFAGVRIADDYISAGKNLKGCDPGERNAWKLVLLDAPDNFAFGRDLDHSVPVTAANECVAVFQPQRREHFRAVSFGSVAGRARASGEIESVAPDDFALAVVLTND